MKGKCKFQPPTLVAFFCKNCKNENLRLFAKCRFGRIRRFTQKKCLLGEFECHIADFDDFLKKIFFNRTYKILKFGVLGWCIRYFHHEDVCFADFEELQITEHAPYRLATKLSIKEQEGKSNVGGECKLQLTTSSDAVLPKITKIKVFAFPKNWFKNDSIVQI